MKVFCVTQILYQTLTGLKKDLSGVQTVCLCHQDDACDY